MSDNVMEHDAIETGPEGLDEDLPEEQKTRKRLTRRRLILRRFLRNRPAIVGVVIYVFLILLALIGPLLLPWNFDDVDYNAFLTPPDSIHWLGTTQGGRDVLALTVRGLGKSLLIGLLVSAISASVAATVGSTAAYFGGWVERGALWIIDLLLVIPSFLLIAMITTGGPKGPHAWLLLVSLLAAFSWILDARVVRSLTMSVKEREYVLAAKFMGLAAPKVIFRHILPNISSLLIIDATLTVGTVRAGRDRTCRSSASASSPPTPRSAP